MICLLLVSIGFLLKDEQIKKPKQSILIKYIFAVIFNVVKSTFKTLLLVCLWFVFVLWTFFDIYILLYLISKAFHRLWKCIMHVRRRIQQVWSMKCWTIHVLKCRRFHYVVEWKRLSDSSVEWQDNLIKFIHYTIEYIMHKYIVWKCIVYSP